MVKLLSHKNNDITSATNTDIARKMQKIYSDDHNIQIEISWIYKELMQRLLY